MLQILVKGWGTAFRDNHPLISHLSYFVAEKFCQLVKAKAVEVNGGSPIMEVKVVFADGAGHHCIVQFPYKGI